MPLTVDYIPAKLKKLNTPSRVLHFVSQQLRPEFLSILEEEGDLLEEHYGLDSHNLVVAANKKLDEVIEKSQLPLRVSLIGVFTSGKTATLCALLNNPRLLPTAQRPTSGNVVEVNIVPPGEAQQQTQIIKCLLFSVVELEEMIRDYFNWLADQFKFRLPAGNVLEQEGYLKNKSQDLLTHTQEQLRDVWRSRNNRSNNVSFESVKALASLYFILLSASRYLEKYPSVSPTESITLSVPYTPQEASSEERLKAVAMLGMEMSLQQLHPDQLEGQVVKFSEALPPTLEELQASCQKGEISTESLRALFPLYKRIVLTREMELQEGWGDIQRVAFLDFPGVGSGNRRDVYLCLRELQLAHVNLLFFLADRPQSEDAHELLDIIAEAKKESTQIGERIIPAINFFEQYAPLPEEVVSTTEDSEDSIVQRVENFFAKKETAGVENGFDVFDEAVLGNLRLGPRWNYFLLTPAAAKERNLLSDNEGHARDRYDKNRVRYGQLLDDLNLAKRTLTKDRAANREQIQKYDRLLQALDDYYRNNDGGVSNLRDELIQMLKSKGARLIAEDARQPLRYVLKELIAPFVAQCEELGIDDENEDAEPEDIVPIEARREVVKLWQQMQEFTEEWLRSGDKAQLRYKAPDSKEYRSPIEVCEDEVLDKVLSNAFWQETDTGHQQTPLRDLVEPYKEIVQALEQWRETVIDEAIKQTLECLEGEMLTLETGDQVSLKDLKSILVTEYLSKATELPEEDKQTLQEMFSFNVDSFAKELRQQLEARKESQEKLYTASSLPNDKVPFNENQVFTWSPEEVMKVQYQLTITLQRRTASYFSFYATVFFTELKKLLKTRLKNIESQFYVYNERGGVFEQLAKVSSQDQDSEKDDMSARERAKKADEAVLKIIQAWHKLLEIG
jgi:hypothetical protein